MSLIFLLNVIRIGNVGFAITKYPAKPHSHECLSWKCWQALWFRFYRWAPGRKAAA